MDEKVGNLSGTIYYLFKNPYLYKIQYPHSAKLIITGRDAFRYAFNVSNLSSKNAKDYLINIFFESYFYDQLKSNVKSNDWKIEIPILANRAIYQMLNMEQKEIEIHSNNYNDFLHTNQNNKTIIRNDILKYIHSRYEELHNKPFLVLEIISAINASYKEIIYQIQYLINEDILKCNCEREQLNRYPIDEFVRFDIFKGESFNNEYERLLKESKKPICVLDNDILTKYPYLNFEKCNVEFKKAIDNLENKPDASLGHACTYIESIAKHILDYFEVPYPNDQSIQPLIKTCSDVLSLSPDPKADKEIKTINNSIGNIANSIGTIRTHFSDFHGKGPNATNLDLRHARYIVNLAYSLSLFLIETFEHTWQNQQKSQ